MEQQKWKRKRKRKRKLGLKLKLNRIERGEQDKYEKWKQ
jgi:hypothetical protein